ncbi:hypothetical protein VUJ46_12915 [Chryseobacterium sp. MYb264]|uniref:hypothetical protein n=1 Tax=Chryseobacterium sp. MYb264 TaxID=2745153 RepID=UPI002E1238C8|nr:hypothetical protein VUJ46_12915 [Chryseobacterium sp. MYb264]
MENEIEELENLIKESEKTLQSIEKKVDKNTDEISRYFDRINDKLFQLNSLLLGMSSIFSYFKIAQYPKWLILLCIYNLTRLIYLEYLNMESRRNWANLKLEKGETLSNRSTKVSLDVILVTIIYMALTLYNIFFN